MSSDLVKAPRGRPKTLSRDHILDVAMQAYWKEGVDGVSLNEVSMKAEVSKPGLYREFGNQDGLMKDVLISYQEKVITPMLQILDTDNSFRETLDNLVMFVITVDEDHELPKGCLIVKMRESRMRMGEATREQLDRTLEQILAVYTDWVERSKAKGDFSADMSSHFAATYIYEQLGYAKSQMERDEKKDDVKKMLTMAFSVFD
ncbi:MAG: TetR family transcriptional regulator [marine bacterium B5-7]|nr:MAG: TetR family transcriptional regulator [marine bacterium B5-7]